MIHVLKEKIHNNPAELKKFVNDKLNKLQDDAVLSEEQQKQENRTVQETLTEIKRENRETQEGIARTLNKVQTAAIVAQRPRSQGGKLLLTSQKNGRWILSITQRSFCACSSSGSLRPGSEWRSACLSSS